MREYQYNCFIEDIMYNNFSDIYDLSYVYDREAYNCLYTLCEYYYNNIVIAKLTYNNVKKKAHDSIENIHRIISHSNNIDAIEFMLLCDCINRINEYFNIDLIIDFDDYIDIDNTCMMFYNNKQMRYFRKRHSYYDYEYNDIDIIDYTAQYIS